MKKLKKVIIISKIILLNLVVLSEFNYRSYSNENINRPNIDYLRKSKSNLDYIIGPGDQIELVINKDTTDLNKIFKIDGEGNAFLERLKKVYVAGLTLNELTSILNEAYAQYVKEPDVTLEMISYRPIRVFVDGEVINPGIITIPGTFSIENSGLAGKADLNNDQIIFPSIYDAIKSAGGITNFANIGKIKVVRKETISKGGGEKTAAIDLTKSLGMGDNFQNIRIYDKDIIYIAKSDKPVLEQISQAIRLNLNPKFITVYISGRVETPGEVKINKLSSLNEALNLAGGTKIIKGKINFTRYLNDGSVDFRKFNYSKSSRRGSYKNPFLLQGDIVYVGKSNLNAANEVISEITNPLRGIVTAFGFYKIIND